MTKIVSSMNTKRIGYIAIVAMIVAFSVLFPIHVETPEPDTYVFRIGNIVTAHDPDATCDGVDDNVQFQQILDALPSDVGGRIEVEAGYYSWNTGETVTRNISNVTIIGVGGLVSFDGDDTTALFTAGGDNWRFENIVTDAGGIDLGSTSDYLLLNVLVDTTFYALVTDDIDILDHGARHESGGDDEIKLDDLGTPDDNTDLNASTERHGLLPKLAGNTSLYLRSDGTWQYVAGGGGGDMLKATYDNDEDGLIDAAAGGTEWDSSAITGVAYITAGTWSSKTLGIADTNILIVSGTVNNGEHCRFTATGIEGLTNSELLADLSGDAGAGFDWNGQDLTNVGNVDGRDVSADGTKLDGIEASADVTDATNVAAAGALMDGDTDNVDDTHINWGSGAGQVDADDILESVTKKWAGETGADVTDATNVNAAGAVMESDFDATTFLYATLDNTPQPKTPAEILAILSGAASAAFDFNGQNIINVGTVDGRDVSADGTKLDGIEAGADVTDADNVNSAGALMESDFDADTFMYATLDDTPTATSPANVLAALSGHAGATFDWNAQTLSNWAIESGATVPVSPAADQLFLHTPTGRNVLLYYDGDSWYPIESYGAMTVYVDGTDGTDGINYGTGVDAAAFATVQYAIDCIPPLYSGDVTININDEAYAETVTISGKSPAGDYSITLQGTLTEDCSGTQSANGAAGSGATQGSFTDTGNLDGVSNLLCYLDADGDYRIIDSEDDDTATIVGTFSSQPLQNENYVVYDWGTSISRIDIPDDKSIIYIYDCKITGSTWSFYIANNAMVYVTRCSFTAALISTGSYVEINTCYATQGNSGYATVWSQYDNRIDLLRCKICATHGSGFCTQARVATIYPKYGTIFDGETGAADDANGNYTFANGYTIFYNSSTNGYCRIRNCDTGIDAETGGMVTGTTNNQYNGNDDDEAAAAGSFAYID